MALSKVDVANMLTGAAPVANGGITSILSFCNKDFVSADALSIDIVCNIAKSLRLSDAIKFAGICVDILSPTVIFLHWFTTCWFVTMCLNLLT